MQSDPRIGLSVSLAVAAAGLLWMLALSFDSQTLFQRFGYSMHAITFLSIFLIVAALAAAAMFWRFSTVRLELLAGQRVLSRWTADRANFELLARSVGEEDRREKRQALIFIWALLAIIFGGFVVFDPSVTVPMLGFGVCIAVALGLAYLGGQRVMRSHLHWRAGEVIVGDRGVLVNGVLHVWAVPLSRLDRARVQSRPPALVIDYGFWTRAGYQPVTIVLPGPEVDRGEMAQAARELSAAAG